MWQVTCEMKPRQLREWTTVVQRYESRAAAEAAYESLLPGPCGSFGPIEYRNLSLCKVHRSCEEA